MTCQVVAQKIFVVKAFYCGVFSVIYHSAIRGIEPKVGKAYVTTVAKHKFKLFFYLFGQILVIVVKKGYVFARGDFYTAVSCQCTVKIFLVLKIYYVVSAEAVEIRFRFVLFVVGRGAVVNYYYFHVGVGLV